MDGVVYRSVGAASVEVMSLGPFFAGLVLRGIWFSFGNPTAQFVDVSLAVCNGFCSLIEDVRAGSSLVESTDNPNVTLGMPAFRLQFGASVGRDMVVPIYVPVTVGSTWIGIAVNPLVGAVHVTAGVVLDLERDVGRSLERGPAARRGVGQGVVMDELRRAAVLARA